MRKPAKGRTKLLSNILFILLPLTALALSGVSSFLWFKELKPEPVKVTHYLPIHASTEEFTGSLERALIEALSEQGIATDKMKVRKADSTNRDINRIYQIDIPECASLIFTNVSITKMARTLGGQVHQGIEDSDGRTLTLKVGTVVRPTDIIILKKVKDVQPSTARMAIIVDDLGIRDVSLARRLVSLGRTVTFSILPFQPYTNDVVELARETGTSYMLHMPMEPKSSEENPGKGAIKVSDIESDIRQELTRAFKSVGGAKGLNNHMGSKATEDIRTMEIVMKYLKENEYFFIDSQTSRKSEAYAVAQKTGVKCALLTRFIDVEDDGDFIASRLDELAETAFQNGIVIAICHDRPTTIEVLERKLPELEKKGIRFVKVEDVVH